ncbi:MAG: hypothetical protein IKO57_07335 [Treponema sp.]|nr:hypothetical protein [Treponema sp.]MBR4630239.1 hypothetical protein [Treponema sp.]MBR6913617.1 hypothetical protein [Treponema sp.]
MKGIKHSRQTLNTSEDNLGTGIEESNGSVSEIVSSLENVTEQLGKQTKCVNETASAVNEIASNIDSLEKLSQAGNEMQGEMNGRITQIEGQSAMLLQANQVIAAIEAAHALLNLENRRANRQFRSLATCTEKRN